MSRPSVPIVLLGLLGLAAVAAAFAGVNRARAQQLRRPPVTTAPARRPAAAPGAAKASPRPVSYGIAEVRAGRSVALRSKPGGRVVADVGARTEFGSPASLSVASTHGAWLGVTSTQLPNGKIAWVKASKALEMHRTPVSIHVDLSKRRLELRKGDTTLRRFDVAIGRPGSRTPTGRFAITDKLAGSRYGPYYGCCILALSGHQTHTPAGWRGGNRLAIHGTDSRGTIGTPASAGCLRAADSNLRVLMRRVPIGTPVFIEA